MCNKQTAHIPFLEQSAHKRMKEFFSKGHTYKYALGYTYLMKIEVVMHAYELITGHEVVLIYTSS